MALRAPIPEEHLAVPRIPMSAAAARDLVAYLQRASGIRVDPRNTTFLTFRMDRRIRELGLASYDEYLRLLKGRGANDEVQRLVESLATHTTSFFREPAHYDWLVSTGLQSVLAYGAGRAHSLTVWSAACSSGQELWSAGMVLEELSAQVQGGLRWNLVGSDISASIVRRASQAVYASADLSGLSQARRSRFLMRSRKGARIAPAQRVYRIVPELRERASFVQANLIQDLTRDIPLADVVFLRNVLIYFSPPDRETVVRNVLNRMRPGAVLLLGHSDNLHALPEGLSPAGVAIFRKEGP